MAASPAVPLAQLDPKEAWQPWKADGWNLKWAGHLFRRAGFGAPPFNTIDPENTWQGLQQAVQRGFEATFELLFKGGPGLAEFSQMADSLAPKTNFAEQFEFDVSDLQGWWMYRMVFTPHPLLEKMTLFWHNHFATSFAKVRRRALMLKQNQLTRSHALGKFRPFLLEMSKDPAMLIWLDSNRNVKGHANENYAREVMELFSLGVGNYTEKDIKEAARAFTGWHTAGGEFIFNTTQHDDGEKTVFGKTGNWDGGDIVRFCCDHEAAPRFLARKLYRQFISESETPPDRLFEPLAAELRRTDYDIAAVVRMILRSRIFFSDYAYRQRIKSPVEFVVGLIRGFDGTASMGNLAAGLEDMGQALFAPPNVKGWDGGKAWLNSATVLARHNLAWAVAGGQGVYGGRIDPVAVAKKHGGNGHEQQADFLLNLLLQGNVHEKARQSLINFLAEGDPKDQAWEARLRQTAHMVLTMPEYQLA